MNGNLKLVKFCMIEQIRLIEIELFSYCNRTCSFCPNSFIDRKSTNKIMDIDIFESLINELSELNYSNYISFSRYNEPLSHRDILEDRIKYIRKILPKVTIVANTNGDYSWENIDIDELTVMDYDNNKNRENLGTFFNKANPKIVRKMKLGKINNRAGALDIKGNFVRNVPCYEPKYFVGIDYTGDVVPCCNIRHDVSIHKPYILGNLNDISLSNILMSIKANKFREDVSNKIFPKICKGCSKMPGRYTADKPSIGNKVS